FEFIEVLVVEHNVLAVLVLEALYYILLLDLPAVAVGASLFILYSAHCLFVYHVEADGIVLHRAVERDRNIHQPETYTAFITVCHIYSLSHFIQNKTLHKPYE